MPKVHYVVKGSVEANDWPDTPLCTWMAKHGRSPSSLAHYLRVPPARAQQYMLGLREPPFVTAQRIGYFTKGRVVPMSWVHEVTKHCANVAKVAVQRARASGAWPHVLSVQEWCHAQAQGTTG